MRDVAISVENLSKQYRLGARKARHDTLREHAVAALGRLLPRNGRPGAAGDTIWALQNVSFQLGHDEVLGIVGANGSGKSTLLKILSRVTPPTAGRARLHGRVASLLEVGTGFDRDLTGRENVYLSGAILGMRRGEIRRKFDEIVAFAEVGKFIDTPVKRYSSGMYVRLAFAVAAHLEPEILIVDEVLAVGDDRFQRRCLSKMRDLGQGGRTVLFVSHNMAAVSRLCSRAILLERGVLVADGPPDAVVAAYLRRDEATAASREWPADASAPSSGVVRLRAVRVRTERAGVTDSVDVREPVAVEMEYEVLAPGRVLMPAFLFFNDAGVHLFSANHNDPAWRGRPRPPGRYLSTVWIPGNFLAEGRHLVDALAFVLPPGSEPEFYQSRAVAFHAAEPEPGPARGDWPGAMRGVVRPVLHWRTEQATGAPAVEAPGAGVGMR